MRAPPSLTSAGPDAAPPEASPTPSLSTPRQAHRASARGPEHFGEDDETEVRPMHHLSPVDRHTPTGENHSTRL
jgi:hypothetical protein